MFLLRYYHHCMRDQRDRDVMLVVVKHNTEYPIKLDIIVLQRGVSAIAAKT